MKKLVSTLMLASALAAGVGVANAQTSTSTVSTTKTAKATTGGFAAHAPAIANALGMTVADLNTALASGKTVAALAKEKGADLTKIIATWVTEEQAEHPDMAAADVTKRVTDQANGVASTRGSKGDRNKGGRGGRHGHKNDTTELATTVTK
jgi:predicted trehalose synthase